MSDLIYIVAEGEYEDEMIEYVCFAKEEAYHYVETNEKEKDCYIIYELRLSTQYDINSEDGLSTEHIIYAPWLRREDGEV